MYFSLKSAMTYIERGKFSLKLGSQGTAAGIYADNDSNDPDGPQKSTGGPTRQRFFSWISLMKMRMMPKMLAVTTQR